MTGAREAPADGGRLASDVQALLDLFRRRWLTLVVATAIVFGAATSYILTTVPVYEATTSIQLDPQRNPLAGAQRSSPPELGSEIVETEVSVLNSQELARQVVKRLGLQDDPDFRSKIPQEIAVSGDEDSQLTAVTRAVKRDLSVGRDRLTYVINVTFAAADPRQAAEIANAFAEVYIGNTIGSRVGTAEAQAGFFQRQLAALEDEVRTAEAAVAQYRVRSGISQGSGATTIVDQQIGPLSTQLATAESAAAEARAQLSAARSQIASGGLDAVSAVRSSPVIADLRIQRAEVLRNVGEVSARYGPRHPESVKVQQQLAELDTQIREEANRAVSALEATARAADARVASLQSSLRQLEGEQAQNTRADVTADSLEREAASKRAAYEQMAQLSLESAQAQSSDIALATIIDRAVPPSAPASPGRSLLLAMALMVALACGCGTVVAQELLAPGIRDLAEFEARVGLPVLAAVPKVAGGESPASLVKERSASLFTESLRIAKASIVGARGARLVKVIALTSAIPGEGKTTTALALARTLAIGGSHTLLIDCDLRRAALRNVAGVSVGAGLVEVLEGQAPLQDALIADQVEGLDLLAVVQPHFGSDEVFGSDKLPELLRELRERYDQIVLDLPPVLGLADSRLLAPLADGVVMVVRWGKTPMSAVADAIGQLQADKAPMTGGIFAMVDPSSKAMGGMYYSREYASYYRAP